MSRERPGNFTQETKRHIRRRCKRKCVITGEKKNTHVHHLLPVAFARDNNVDLGTVKHHSNGVVLHKGIHKDLHRELDQMEPSTKLTLYRAMYVHIQEARKGELSPKLLESKPPLYEVGEIPETVIYQAPEPQAIPVDDWPINQLVEVYNNRRKRI